MTAAQQITDTIDRRDYIIVITGFILPPKYVQESDGPPGAVALARALNLAFEAKPILIIEEKSQEFLLKTLRAAKMRTTDIKELAQKETAVSLIDFPLNLNKAEEKAERILEKYSPAIIIAIEKPGKNSEGEYHTMRGLNITSFHAKVEPLIEKGNRQGILTIGIGDGGNEVGMGNIKRTVEEYVPFAKTCQCPCKGGIAAESRVSLLVTASISNWGAYGIEACLQAVTKKKGILHDPLIEESMLKSLFEAGAVNGVSCQNRPLVDGIPHNIHLSMINMLHTLICS
jgi:hypothetical protein